MRPTATKEPAMPETTSLAVREGPTCNIYCDESCHLENDEHKVMVLGALWHEVGYTRRVAEEIRRLKREHGLPERFEVKWTKVSNGKLEFYRSLMDFFFDDPALHFRALIVPDKTRLRHAAFGQDHDTWYYKMYFDMLKVLLDPNGRYFIYIDIKDTRSGEKLTKLHEVLCNDKYDFRQDILRRVQAVPSNEVEQIQLADMLIGAVSYANRGVQTSAAKLALVEHMRQQSRYCLTKTTLLLEDKVNLFRWRAQEVQA
jgi:hypothetical protein